MSRHIADEYDRIAAVCRRVCQVDHRFVDGEDIPAVLDVRVPEHMPAA